MNSSQGVYMDIPAVRGISVSLNNISLVLTSLGQALQALMMVLETTAFVGIVGGYALIRYLKTTKPLVDEMAKKCSEISKDLAETINAYERGDRQGGTRFY